ncbi:uncharacterized protein LOC143487016 [Brachyhypopomus gauderio]|uniref:uncharacterized protein LOC143487016 n=1 Tax=Brachyhypopomus gauderio TaxID=698409 RepID=UPI0040422885
MEALQKYIQRRDAEKSSRPETRSVPAPATVPCLPGLSKRRTSTASRSTQDPTDAELLAALVELDVEAPSSSAVPAPPQHFLPTAEPEQQPSQTQPVPTAEVLLHEGWKQTLPKEQHQWVSRALFNRDQSGRLALTKNLRLWWSPPGLQLVYTQPPSSSDTFSHSRLFLWMPYRMWAFKLLCVHPECRRLGHKLTACGTYKTVRRVLDFSGWYFMATEDLECHRCKKKVAGWSQDILDQLDPVHREKFPVILTYR